MCRLLMSTLLLIEFPPTWTNRFLIGSLCLDFHSRRKLFKPFRQSNFPAVFQAPTPAKPGKREFQHTKKRLNWYYFQCRTFHTHLFCNQQSISAVLRYISLFDHIVLGFIILYLELNSYMSLSLYIVWWIVSTMCLCNRIEMQIKKQQQQVHQLSHNDSACHCFFSPHLNSDKSQI